MDGLEARILSGPGQQWWQRLLAAPLLWVWLALASYWLLRGLLGRAGAVSPGLPELLNQIGLSLWVAGALLAPAYEQLLRRCRQNQGVGGAGGLAGNMLDLNFAWPWFTWSGFSLALACLPALLPYTPGHALMLAATADPVEFELRLLPACIGFITAGGGLAVLLSLGLYSALRRWIGPTLAAGPWLAAVLLLHWQALNGSDMVQRSARGDLPWLDRVPLSLGQQFVELVTVLRSIGNSPPYLNEILLWLTALTAGLLTIAGLLLLLAALGRRSRALQPRLLPIMLAAGIMVPLASLIPGVLMWLSQAEVPAPGDWTTLAPLGLGAVWLVYWLATWPRALDAKAQPQGPAWLLLFWILPACWALMSWPAVIAGQSTQKEVLFQALVALFLLAPGCSLIAAAQRLSRSWPLALRTLLQLVPLSVLLCPLDGAERSLPRLLLETLPQALAQPEARPEALLILGLLAAFHTLIQLMLGRPLRPGARRRASAGPLVAA